MPRTQPTPRSRRHFPRPHAHLPHRLPGTLRDNAVQAPRQRRHDTLTTPSRHPHGGVVTNRPARPSHSAALTYEKAPPRLSFTHIAAFLFRTLRPSFSHVLASHSAYRGLPFSPVPFSPPHIPSLHIQGPRLPHPPVPLHPPPRQPPQRGPPPTAKKNMPKL